MRDNKFKYEHYLCINPLKSKTIRFGTPSNLVYNSTIEHLNIRTESNALETQGCAKNLDCFLFFM